MEKFLRSNNFARILAFFLAVIMWLFVSGDNLTRTTPTEPVKSALFKVHLEFLGAPAAGWARQDYTYDPGSIRVEAPRSIFDLIDRVVLRVDLTGAREQYRADLVPVVLDAQDRELAGVTIIPDQVSVWVTLVKEKDFSP
jgi:YbbR domain-containing protein